MSEQQPYSPLADAIVACCGFILVVVAYVLSAVFAPVAWLYGMLGGRK